MDLADITKDLQGGNMGGIAMKVFYGLWKDVLTHPTVPSNPATLEENGKLTGAVIMKPGKRMFQIDITDDTGELENEPVGPADGHSFIQHLRFFSPGLQAKMLGFMNATINEDLVFIAPDNNGRYFYLGSELRPATFMGSPDEKGTGKETASRRGQSSEFVFKTKGLYEYVGTVPLTIAVPES
jgi:hypothetical protein